MGDLSGLLNGAGIEIQDSKITPALLGELIHLIKDGTISGKIAKSVLPEVFETGKSPRRVVEQKGLAQISDSSAIETIIDQVIADNPSSAQDYRDGKKKAIGFLVGQVIENYQRKSQPADGQPDFEKEIGRSIELRGINENLRIARETQFEGADAARIGGACRRMGRARTIERRNSPHGFTANACRILNR